MYCFMNNQLLHELCNWWENILPKILSSSLQQVWTYIAWCSCGHIVYHHYSVICISPIRIIFDAEFSHFLPKRKFLVVDGSTGKTVSFHIDSRDITNPHYHEGYHLIKYIGCSDTLRYRSGMGPGLIGVLSPRFTLRDFLLQIIARQTWVSLLFTFLENLNSIDLVSCAHFKTPVYLFKPQLIAVRMLLQFVCFVVLSGFFILKSRYLRI